MRGILEVICQQEVRFSFIIEDSVMQLLIKESISQIKGDFIIVHIF